MTRKDFNNKYGMSDFTEGFVTFCVENNRGNRHIFKVVAFDYSKSKSARNWYDEGSSMKVETFFKRYNISSSLMEKACELATSMGLANKITFTIGGEDVVCEYNHNEVEFF